MDRRSAIKWMLSAATTAMLADSRMLGATVPANPPAAGYGMDPDIIKICATYKPGDLWPLTFTDAQRRTAIALCDVIIPEDSESPAASKVGVPDFIDEWVSAPYADHARDRETVVDGLAWIDEESKRRFSCLFADATGAQKAALCDDICYVPKAAPELRQAAQFFARYRDLTAGGFYTTPEGFKDLKYVGNLPSATFDGPPIEVIKKLGLEDVAGL
jgi:hypothetical protein